MNVDNEFLPDLIKALMVIGAIGILFPFIMVGIPLLLINAGY